MQRVKPILCAPLFTELDKLLLECLRSLSPADWDRKTLAAEWSVKDVTAHLLDTNLRGLSMLRDQYAGEPTRDSGSYTTLLAYLNRLNADWVRAFRRVSPDVLMDLLEITGGQFCNCMQSLDPSTPARFSVAWAGETQSPNWFHVAREYTEKWHHQQQIRIAVGGSDILLTERYYLPYLDTSMRALPHHYRGLQADEKTCVRFTIRGFEQAPWYLVRINNSWELFEQCEAPISCSVVIDSSIAWRIFTKSIPQTDARRSIHVDGDVELGSHILGMIAVMA